MRGLLDHLAAALLDEPLTRAITNDLAKVRERLAEHAVAETDQVFGRRLDVPGHGQTLVPPFVVTSADPNEMRATLTFGRYFLGTNAAVHGGAITLLFENVFGLLANTGGRAFGRAAYTHVDFRSVTPVGRELTLHAWFESEIGRKWILRGQLRDGDQVCAGAEDWSWNCVQATPDGVQL